jgi:hypothetical protein
MGKGEKEKTF